MASDFGKPAAKVSMPRLPLRLNFTGTACPALSRFSTGRLSTGWKNPETCPAFTEAGVDALRAVGERHGEAEGAAVESELPEAQRGDGLAIQRVAHRDHLRQRAREIDASLPAAAGAEKRRVSFAGGERGESVPKQEPQDYHW